MADITFDQLVDEQKKTTSSLNRLGKTLRQQLLGDKSQEKDQSRVDAGNKAWQTRQTNIAKAQEKDQSRVDAGNKAWQTRQTNIAEAGIKVGEITAVVEERQTSFLGSMLDKLNFFGKGTKSASQKKEDKKDEQSFMSKMFGGLSKSFEKGFSILGKGLDKFKSKAMDGFKALLTAAGLFLLIKFLQSKTWKKIREWIAENPLEGVMIALIAIAAFFNPITTFKLIRGAVKLFIKPFIWLFDFIKWGGKHLKDFTKARIAGAPMKSMEALSKGMKSIGKFFGKISKSFQAWMKGGSKIGKVVGDVVKWVGNIFKSVTSVGSKFGAFAKGILRFAGPLGIIVTVAMAMWETIKSMKDRFKETGSWLETIQTGLATFIGQILGFIPDLIKGAISWIFEKLGSIFGIESFTNISTFLDSFSFVDLITQGYEQIFDLIEAGMMAVVNFDYAGTFTKIKDTITEKFGLIKDTITEKWDMAVTSIKDAIARSISRIGIGIKSAWNNIKDTITEKWDSIPTGIKDFFISVATFIPNMIKNSVSWVSEKLGEIFGIEAFKDFSAFLDKVDIAELITNAIELVIDKIKGAFSGLWGMIESIAPTWLKKMAGIESSPEEPGSTSEAAMEKDDERTERIKKLEVEVLQVSDLESGDVEGLNTEANIKKARDELKKLKEEEMRRKRTLAGDSSWKVRVNKYTSDMDQSKPRSLENVQRGLDLFGEMKGKGSEEQQGMVLKQMQLLEKRKAELEAAKSGAGATVTNIAQNNSTNMKSSTIRSENLTILDLETVQVHAVNI
jgi:ABC-type proline/glycine betaine transport system permease subunit